MNFRRRPFGPVFVFLFTGCFGRRHFPCQRSTISPLGVACLRFEFHATNELQVPGGDFLLTPRRL